MADDKPNQIQSILNMIDDAEGKFLEIGSALLQIKDNDPGAFATLIEAPALSRRRAYYLIRIVTAFEHKPHLHERLRGIGWTKAELLVKHAEAANFGELLDLAEHVTAHDLKAFLKHGPAGLGGGVLVFSLPAGAYAKVTQALKACGAYQTPAGLRNKEAALLQVIANAPVS